MPPAAAPDTSTERDSSHDSDAISFDGKDGDVDLDQSATDDEPSTSDRFEALRDELRSTGTVEPVVDESADDDGDPDGPSDEPSGEWGLPSR